MFKYMMTATTERYAQKQYLDLRVPVSENMLLKKLPW